MNRSEPVRVYQSSPILRLGSPLLAVLVAAATTAGIQTVIPYQGPWAPVIGAVGGTALASALLLWTSVTRRRLEVFDGWFRYVLPHRTLIAHWDDVLEVYSPTTRRRRLLGRHEYVVVLGGGTTLRLGSQVGADAELGDEIEARTRSVVAARAAAHLDRGREARFGPITVAADGIEVRSLGRTMIPYERLRDQRLGGRHWFVRSKDRRRTIAVPISKIPSPGALCDLIDRQVERRAVRPAPIMV